MSRKKNAPLENESAVENTPDAQPETAEAPEAAAEQTEPAAAAEAVTAEQVAALEAELAAEKDRYLRLLAEYDNYRRRCAKERENLASDARADTITKFLPVYDNLARALAQETADEAYRKGVEMIMTQFLTVLEKMGAAPMESLGQRFDPTLHNAVMHTDDEEKGENEIVEEFQKGFVLGDKVIRFAMVRVAN